MMSDATRLDAAESVYFTRQLEFVKSKTYEAIYRGFVGREVVPVSFDIPDGAQSFISREFDLRGNAKIISNYADDLPSVNVLASESSNKLKVLGTSYQYSIEDIKAAAYSGMPLTDKYARACRRVIEAEIESITALGSADYGLGGFLNATGVTNTTVTTAASGTNTWTVGGKTGLEILADLNKVYLLLETALQQTGIRPNAICLPGPALAYAETARLDSSNTTALEFWLKHHPEFRGNIHAWDQCVGNGAGGTNRLVMYWKDPEALTLEIPRDFTQHNAQQRNLAYIVPCTAKIGGVVYNMPVTGYYIDGV